MLTVFALELETKAASDCIFRHNAKMKEAGIAGKSFCNSRRKRPWNGIVEALGDISASPDLFYVRYFCHYSTILASI
jgi:hypothetical protein